MKFKDGKVEPESYRITADVNGYEVMLYHRLDSSIDVDKLRLKAKMNLRSRKDFCDVLNKFILKKFKHKINIDPNQEWVNEINYPVMGDIYKDNK